jgi:hypothetical protein
MFLLRSYWRMPGQYIYLRTEIQIYLPVVYTLCALTVDAM